MRTLILTCNTGGGHNSCSKAIQEIFLANGAQCDITDAIQFVSEKLSRFMSWGHTTMYRYVPELFRWGYGLAEKHSGRMQEDAAVYKLLSAGAEQLRGYICSGGYDTVICTHVFSAILLAQMLREHPAELKTAFVATDYTCSPGAAVRYLDRYFIPHGTLLAEFEAQGIPADKIAVSGIPVAPSFYSRQEREAAKQAVGVSAEHSHLLMMCGSMGCGPLEELTQLLGQKMDGTMELTIVCGTNEKLRRSLEKLTAGKPSIHICGFVSNMDALMDSAELCLTKPGGLSTTEAAAKRLPMVLIDAVAGCEEHNLNFFVGCGGAVTADDTAALAELCIDLLRDPKQLAAMSEKLAGITERPAAEVIFETLRDLSEG